MQSDVFCFLKPIKAYYLGWNAQDKLVFYFLTKKF